MITITSEAKKTYAPFPRRFGGHWSVDRNQFIVRLSYSSPAHPLLILRFHCSAHPYPIVLFLLLLGCPGPFNNAIIFFPNHRFLFCSTHVFLPPPLLHIFIVIFLLIFLFLFSFSTSTCLFILFSLS